MSGTEAIEFELVNKLKRFEIHGIYCAIIAAIFIVYLASRSIADNKQANDYIGFAATLSSLILAVLAIFITIIGNSDIGKLLGSLAANNSTLERSANSIDTNLKTDAANKTALNIEIKSLASIVNTLQQKVDIGFQEVKTSFALGNNFQRRLISANIQGTLEFTKNDFLSSTSINGLFLLLCASRVSNTRDRIVFQHLSDAIGITDRQYLWGYLMACTSAGICDVDVKGETYAITDMKFTHQEIQDVLNRVADRFTSNNKPSDAEALKTRIQNVISYATSLSSQEQEVSEQ